MVLGAVDRKAEISFDRGLPPRVRHAEPLHPLHLGGHLDMEPDCPAIIENCIVLCHLLPIGQALAVVTSTFIIVADIEPRDFSSIKDYVLIIGDCYSLKIWIEADVNRKRAVRFVGLVFFAVSNVHSGHGQSFSNNLLVTSVDVSGVALLGVEGVQWRGHEHIAQVVVGHKALICCEASPDEREAWINAVWPPGGKLDKTEWSINVGRVVD